ATIDYQKCVTRSARKVCPNINIYSTENMDDLTQGLFTKFNSTCYKRKKKTTTAVSKILTTVAPLKTPLCSETSALKALMECMGFIHMKVIPNTVARGNPEMLKVACRSMKHYQHCVNQKIETCENSQVLESLMIKYYTGELYRKYEWTCQPVAPKAVCNPLLVLGHLENCSKELNHTIQGLNPEEANSLKLDKACMGVSAYHSCINSHVNVKCGNKLLPQNPHVLHYTRDLYNMYNWTCQPEHGDNCDGSEVLDSLTECLGFLNVLVIPYVQNSSKYASLETACSGYQEFKYCALLSVYGKCARRPYVLKLPRVQYFTHDLVQSYKWTCDAIHHGKASVCQTDVLLSQLKKCYDDHVKKHVLPNADIGGPSAKMQLACLALNRYQECVNEEVSTNCGNNQGQVLMLDAVKNYTYIVYEQFQWACDMHPDCNKNSLLNELTTCKGIINIKVVPNALNMSDNAKLREACRGIQFYQACVNEKKRLKCAMDSPVFLLPEVAYFTFVMFNKFNWTCFHRSQEGKISELVNETEVVKQLRECHGFILFSVERALYHHFKENSMREACLGVQNYQKCIVAKLEQFHDQNFTMPDSQIVKYYTMRLFGKYNWTCDSLDHKKKCHLCSVDKLENGLRQCRSLADSAKAAAINKSNLESVCEYYLDHLACIEDQLQECRFMPTVLKLGRIRRHTQLLDSSYKKYCSFLMKGKNECTTKLLPGKYEQCLGFVSNGVIPNLGSDTTELDLPAVQRYLDDYKSCIQEMTKLACGSIDLSLDVQTSLAVPVQIVRKYSHFISTNNCSDNSLTSALRECDGIWDLDVDPLLKHTDNSDLIQACSSIEIFGNCVKQKVIPLCEKMEVASTHPSVHSYLSNALDVYKTICSQDLNAVSEAMCNKPDLLIAFMECGGIIDYRVVPFSDDPNDDVKLEIACRGVKEYKRCIFSRLNTVCQEKIIPMSNDITKYLRNYYNLYDWVCNDTTTGEYCHTEELKQNLTKCVGLLNKEFDISVTGLDTDYFCTFLEDYKLCLSTRTSLACRKNEQAMRSPEIIYLTRDIVSKFMSLCNMIDIKECSRDIILEIIHKCKGFINYILIDSLQDSTDPLGMKEACRGISYYHHCVQSEVFKVCDVSSPVLQDQVIQEYMVGLTRNLSWVCDLNTKPENCTVKNILPYIAECQGFIEGIGDPHNLRKADSFGLNVACSFIQQYKECIDLNIRYVCREPKVLSEVSEISFYTQDLYYKYSWTCNKKKSGEICDTDKLLSHLEQCNVFLVHGVMPYVDNSFETLKYSYVCENFASYTRCLQRMKSKICQSKDIMAHPKIKMFLHNKYNEYKWYCSSKKVTNGDCNQEHLENELKHCLGFVMTIVRPKLQTLYNFTDEAVACSALEDYRHCVVSKISRHCGYDTTIVQKSLIRQYLFDLYNKYKWICEKVHKIECTPQHLALHAKNCELHLNFSSAPHVGIRDQDSSILLLFIFRGLHEYQSCLRHIYFNLCAYNNSMKPWNTTYLLSSKRIKNIQEACSRQKDPIGIDVCNTKVLNDLSHRCHGIIDTNLIPNVRKKNNSPKLHEACSALTQFQQCINRNLGHCNTTAALSKEVPQKYSWVCKETSNHTTATTCNETVLLEEMQECLGIMYFIVIPNAAMKKDQASLANAC
ncbi:hypothetical protein HPB47_022663, partial [Ixodes persulcatus]